MTIYIYTLVYRSINFSAYRILLVMVFVPQYLLSLYIMQYKKSSYQRNMSIGVELKISFILGKRIIDGKQIVLSI
jgi:hypothetical protein